MPATGMTPEREEQLTADLLRERVGIDPGNAGQLARPRRHRLGERRMAQYLRRELACRGPAA
jgi:hypothetical protein